ncbi:MFS transporter [Luteimicrobium subarcticum]|uniref:EmrB/QacA subfamily drug resistance transporter n=1 Tax=Luteimicrobium subarcticum TaxID=620910 RepID=A0A2M8W6Y2_9MICO|nr:MFS transporter [Luteimicrobium subarcticum]PJI86695.1 EmrB/QacA subfamily drug resistance transporter [Luteimicrobium subarcticum]
MSDQHASVPLDKAASSATTVEPHSGGEVEHDPHAHLASYPKRWAALAVIAIAQLVIVLDTSIMNVALPSAAEDLDISPANIQWAVTAYTLAFGGLLLLGGRIADYLGRKRTFIIGLIGFAAASGLGGMAMNEGWLFGSRALQGVFGALLAPAALSLITVMFVEPHERARAFGVFGAIAGGGAAIGLIAGGVLTEYLDWRWCLYVNVPIVIVTAIFAARIVPESKAAGDTRLDIPGAILATGGLVALVYGFTEAAKQTTDAQGNPTTVGWTDPLVLTLFAVAVVALVLFVYLQTRVKNPLLPLRIVLDRNRGGSYLVFLLAGAGMFAMFLFLTLYFQDILGWEPLKTGFAMLPFSLGIIAMAGVVSRLLPKLGPKPLMIPGLAFATIGLLLLTRTSTEGSYWTQVFPGILVMSLGMAAVFIPVSSTALIGVGGHDAGIASAVLNTSQQIGGSLGLALLNTVAISAATDKIGDLVAGGANPKDPMTAATAQVHGFHTAYVWGAGFFAIALLIAAFVIVARRDSLPAEGAVAA